LSGAIPDKYVFEDSFLVVSKKIKKVSEGAGIRAF